ncbi:MAG: histidinol-phosphate aminotransferase family protein [Saprospiraceae bacterium]|nr:histidinol-phosphate aminotransferase family protein [Saprospiraceae bacterium]
MQQLNRRSWLRGFATLGAGTLVVSPTEILKALPSESQHLAFEGEVRLSSNENPYSPSAKMQEAINKIGPELCRYPNRHFATLEKMIAEREGVDAENVVVTSGSREGLNVTGLLYGMNGGEILTCMPTYKALLTYAERFGAYINIAPLDADLGMDLDALDRRIHSNTRLVFVCNPNNPTGTLLDRDRLKTFCRQASKRTMVFVDEAYFDYIDEENYPSMSSLVKEGHNIIVSRTFSKVYGLAGVRVGFLIARSDIATRLRQRLMSGTNIMGVRLAIAGMEDQEFYRFCLQKNREAREIIYAAIDEVNLPYKRSHTNFVFFHTGRDIRGVIGEFREKGVLVGRPFPPFSDWCRISTGKIEEVQTFASALKQVFT